MFPTPPQPDALLVRAAALRAHGLAWEAVADELETDVDDLRQRVEDAGPTFRKLFAIARRDATEEAYTEALFALRRELRSKDEKGRREAAGIIMKLYMTRMRHRPRKPAVKDGPQSNDPLWEAY